MKVNSDEVKMNDVRETDFYDYNLNEKSKDDSTPFDSQEFKKFEPTEQKNTQWNQRPMIAAWVGSKRQKEIDARDKAKKNSNNSGNSNGSGNASGNNVDVKIDVEFNAVKFGGCQLVTD